MVLGSGLIMAADVIAEQDATIARLTRELADRDARLARIAKGKWDGGGRSVGKFCCSHCEAIDGDPHAVDCPLYDWPTKGGG